MTDEKKPADLDAGGAKTGSPAPDQLRRKLAKAALAAPVIMTFNPRSVLGASCSTNTFSVVWHSLSTGAAMISAARTDLTDLEQCVACIDPDAPEQENYDNCVKDSSAVESTTSNENETLLTTGTK